MGWMGDQTNERQTNMQKYHENGTGNNKKAHTANKKLWEKHTHLRNHSNPVEAS